MIKPNSFFHHAFFGHAENYIKATMKPERILDLSTGEVEQTPSRKIQKALTRIRAVDLIGYPDPTCRELKTAIANRFGVSETLITVGNGSDEIIENIGRVFLEPGDPCLFAVPTFFRFIESCRKIKAKIITVATEEKDGFLITPKMLIKIKTVIRKKQPKIIWLDSPNSVSGTVIPLKIVKEIPAITRGLVVIDEVHHELIDPENEKSATKFLSKHKNLIVIRSVSKAFGLAGIRLGFALAHPSIIKPLEKWRLTFTINTITQKLALAALIKPLRLNKVAYDVQKRRQKIFSAIRRIPGFVIGADSQTHLFLLKHQTLDLFESLKRHGILAADLRQAPGLEGKGFVRLNIKTPKEAGVLLKALRIIYNEEINRHGH